MEIVKNIIHKIDERVFSETNKPPAVLSDLVQSGFALKINIWNL